MSPVDVKHGDCIVHQYQCNKVHFSFMPNLLPPALCLGRPALCHWPSRARHISNSLSHDDGARECPLHSCFPWRTTLSHERKAVWEVQMVLSLMHQHSDHSQGACTYGQCGPFLLWCRWHCKKKKTKEGKKPSLQTPKANTQTAATLRVPNPSFLLLGVCCPRKIKAFSLQWSFHAVRHACFGQLLKCKWTLI